MPHYLLLGAGFTRNWGGPLSEEITGSLLGELHDDAELAGALRDGPFEDAFQGFATATGPAEVVAPAQISGRSNRRFLTPQQNLPE